MRAPLDWLREYVDLPAEINARALADRLVSLGLEVETVDRIAQVDGPVVLGRVLSFDELADFKKPIRLCKVDVGAASGGVRTIVCGATNFSAGDGVVVALPGAVLPGGFEIVARKTYGHVSDGMLCSAAELQVGAGHEGIIVGDVCDDQIGQSAAERYAFNLDVLDIAVTPDRGYAFSIRGVAREAAMGLDCEFNDSVVAAHGLPAPTAGEPIGCGFEENSGCEVFTARTLRGVNCSAPTPTFIAQRLVAAGMRPISLVVDVTNYVMLASGQPLHAFDAGKISGGLQARRARTGEQLTTLDGVARELSAEDLVIADDEGPVALAGTMGGALTEISATSSDVVLEAAYFDPVVVAKMSRRHKLSSEASKRFERGVDRGLAPYASELAASLILEHGGGEYVGMTAVESAWEPKSIQLPLKLAADVSGADISTETVNDVLHAVGCQVEVAADQQTMAVTPPSWRPDLQEPADLVEEIVRVFGYEQIPVELPRIESGTGLTRGQRSRRRLRQAAADAGLVEVLNYPFVGENDLALSLADQAQNSELVRLVNPLSDEQPYLRQSLLTGLFACASRNLSRGASSVHIFEIGTVYLGASGTSDGPREFEGRPTDEQISSLNAGLPAQPLMLAGVLSGDWERSGWWGQGRTADWTDTLRICRDLLDVIHLDADPTPSERPGFHPGRSADLLIADTVVGHAGELHPQLVANWNLTARSCAFELDLTVLLALAAEVEVRAKAIKTLPVAKFDLALVVEADVVARRVEAVIRDACGELLEAIRLFDVYQGDQVPSGKKSLTFAIRLRAADRTLAEDEVSAVRQRAIEAAAAELSAQLRS